MGLIEKIESLYDKRYQGCESVNEVINDVLDIIKAEFVEKELPDSDGWWWIMNEYPVCVKIYEHDGVLCFQNSNRILRVKDFPECKWVKAMLNVDLRIC